MHGILVIVLKIVGHAALCPTYPLQQHGAGTFYFAKAPAFWFTVFIKRKKQ
jgi:hypothetical protein